MVGHEGGVRLRDFDVVAEDAVVGDLERLDAGAFALAGLEFGEEAADVAGDEAKGVELGREAGADDVAGIDGGAGLVGDGLGDGGGDIGAVAELGDDGSDARVGGGVGGGAHACGRGGLGDGEGADRGDAFEAAAEGDEFAGCGLAGDDAGDDALEVGHGGEVVEDLGAAEGAFVAPGDGVEAGVDCGDIAEGLADAAAEETGAHRRAGVVEGGEQRAIAAEVAAGSEELEVAHGVGIEADVLRREVGAERRDEGDAGGLVVAQVHEDGAAGGDGGGRAVDAERFGGGDAEVFLQRDGGEVVVEPEGLDGGDVVAGGEPWRRACAFGDEDLGRANAGESGDGVVGGHGAGGELAGGDVEPGDAGLGSGPGVGAAGAAGGGEAGEIVVGLLVEEVALDDGAGGDDADDLALDEALGGGGVAHLLAEGDLVALRDELREVAIDGVVRDAGERDAEALAHRLGGEGDVELARAEFGVVVEGLVEVAEAEEDDGVWVAALDVEVLAADGGEGVHGGECSGFVNRGGRNAGATRATLMGKDRGSRTVAAAPGPGTCRAVVVADCQRSPASPRQGHAPPLGPAAPGTVSRMNEGEVGSRA